MPELVTLKLDAIGDVVVSVNPNVWSMSVPKLVTISIDVFCQAVLSIAPVVPLMVACAPENVTVPKLASGKTPKKDDGAFHDPFGGAPLGERALRLRRGLRTC